MSLRLAEHLIGSGLLEFTFRVPMMISLNGLHLIALIVQNMSIYSPVWETL